MPRIAPMLGERLRRSPSIGTMRARFTAYDLRVAACPDTYMYMDHCH